MQLYDIHEYIKRWVLKVLVSSASIIHEITQNGYDRLFNLNTMWTPLHND